MNPCKGELSLCCEYCHAVTILTHLTAVITPEGEVACVSSLMPDEFIPVSKLLLAEVACVTFCIFVNPRVFGQVFSLGKPLTTDLTHKSFTNC